MRHKFVVSTATATALLMACFFMSVGLAKPEADAKQALAAVEQSKSRAYLTTVPPLAMLIEKLFGTDVDMQVIIESVDYHMPQYTIKDLRAWLKSDTLVWMGPELEPQLLSLAKKLKASRRGYQVLMLENLSDSAHEPVFQHGHTVAEHQYPGPDPTEAKHHDHHHGKNIHDHNNAHAWLDFDRMVRWSRLLIKAIENESSSEVAVQKIPDQIEQEFLALISHWKIKFSTLDNLTLIQEHDVFGALLAQVGVTVIGSLTTQHDVAIGMEALSDLVSKAKDSGTQCLIAMPGRKTSYPPQLFKDKPRVEQIDPFGLAHWQEGGDLIGYYESIFTQVYTCLGGESDGQKD